MSKRQCTVCEADISHRGPKALYCEECMREKKREAVRRHRGVGHIDSAALGKKARRIYAEWKDAGMPRPKIGARLNNMSVLKERGRDAVSDPTVWPLYRGWLSEGMTNTQIHHLLVDLRCMHDMERDAVIDAPRSQMGSAAISVMEG